MKDRNHDLTKDDANTLLSVSRECAHAPCPKPEESVPNDHYYNIAVSNLKKALYGLRINMFLSGCLLSG